MATFSAVAMSLGLSFFLLLLVSPAVSLTCTSQTLKNKEKFDKCLDLPVLDSYLHYSYNATNSSLSIAFVAPPAKPQGWIAWAINPTGQGMIGSQALLAFKSDNKVVVKTLDVSSFSSISESKLSFETWDLSGEATSNGNLVIYGSMKVEEKAEMLNQVWQVGSEVEDGMPLKHGFQPENMKSKGTLVLAGGGGSVNASSTNAPSSSPTATPGEDPVKGGQSLIKSNHLASFFGFVFFVASVFLLI
ncbi:hypothetical protein ACOSQ2_033343 [Xanthoceras sorbifolium]|uniref:DOMON domain-containing protein n=1 Tax=Xanthoceras sorbifolium TaxID=99658 RepID=A0ABQ8H395_9ROSI|nr:hypothetical protein JRO89_XS14G0014700 [Xanthoceras sorbifolium]